LVRVKVGVGGGGDFTGVHVGVGVHVLVRVNVGVGGGGVGSEAAACVTDVTICTAAQTATHMAKVVSFLICGNHRSRRRCSQGPAPDSDPPFKER
jgi:hypothetical protein